MCNLCFFEPLLVPAFIENNVFHQKATYSEQGNTPFAKKIHINILSIYGEFSFRIEAGLIPIMYAVPGQWLSLALPLIS